MQHRWWTVVYVGNLGHHGYRDITTPAEFLSVMVYGYILKTGGKITT
uniref:Uncharacterized protein n=1 Tax=Aegilops tauschii subsp. strangulata TaxID=200361 RepID=A0A453QJ11_AEGTS